jgi:hypothetical protein
MTIISFSNAYALYAHETFEKHRAMMCGNMDAWTRLARAKYVERGWTMVSRSSACHTSFNEGLRHIGDRFTWRIPLPSFPDLDPSIRDHLPIHSWRLRCRPRPPTPDNDYQCGKMAFRNLSSPVLKSSYVIFDFNLAYLLHNLLIKAEEHRRKLEQSAVLNAQNFWYVLSF